MAEDNTPTNVVDDVVIGIDRSGKEVTIPIDENGNVQLFRATDNPERFVISDFTSKSNIQSAGLGTQNYFATNAPYANQYTGTNKKLYKFSTNIKPNEILDISPVSLKNKHPELYKLIFGENEIRNTKAIQDNIETIKELGYKAIGNRETGSTGLLQVAQYEIIPLTTANETYNIKPISTLQTKEGFDAGKVAEAFIETSLDTPTNVVDDIVDYDLVDNEFGELLPVIKNPNNFPLPANTIFGRPLSQDEFMRILIERDRDVYLKVFEDAASITGIKLPDYKPSTIKKVFGMSEYNFNKYASSYYDDYLIKTYWQNKQKDIVDIVQKIKTGQINNINSKKLTQFIYELQAFETSGRFQDVDEKADIVKKIIFGNEPILETGVDFGSDFGKYVEAVGVDKEVVTILQNNSENIKTILKDTINKELKNIYPNEYIVVFRSPNINTLDDVDNLLNSYSKDLSVSQEMSRYQTPDGNVPYFATEEGKAGVKAYLVPTNEIIDTEALGIRGGIKQNEKEILINPDKVTELDVSVIEDMKSNKEIKINKLLSETPTNVVDDIKMKPIFTGTEAPPTGNSFVYADVEEIFDFVQFNRRNNPTQTGTTFSSDQIDAIKKTILEKGYIYDTGEFYNSAVVFPVSVDISGEIQIGEGNHRLLAAYEVAKETGQKIYVPIHVYTGGGVVKGGQNQTRLVDRKNLYNALKELFKDVGASEYTINSKIGETFDSVKQYGGANYLGSGGSGGNSTSQENIKKFFTSIGVDTFTYQELPEDNVFKTGVNTLTDTPTNVVDDVVINKSEAIDNVNNLVDELPLEEAFKKQVKKNTARIGKNVATPGGIMDLIDAWELGVLGLAAAAISLNEVDEIPTILYNQGVKMYNNMLSSVGLPVQVEEKPYNINFEKAIETLNIAEMFMPTAYAEKALVKEFKKGQEAGIDISAGLAAGAGVPPMQFKTEEPKEDTGNINSIMTNLMSNISNAQKSYPITADEIGTFGRNPINVVPEDTKDKPVKVEYDSKEKQNLHDIYANLYTKLSNASARIE